jgi:hypothetical protein
MLLRAENHCTAKQLENTTTHMKRIILFLALTAVGVGTKASDGTAALQLSLTPDIALQSRDTTIKGISLNIWGENPQRGAAIGCVNGSTGDSSGFSLGFVNYSETYWGVQFGIVNTSSKLYVGWQDGLVNVTKEMHGFQSGLVNYTESLTGVQLGLVCIVKDNPWFSEFPKKLAQGFPFVNWSF